MPTPFLLHVHYALSQMFVRTDPEEGLTHWGPRPPRHRSLTLSPARNDVVASAPSGGVLPL